MAGESNFTIKDENPLGEIVLEFFNFLTLFQRRFVVNNTSVSNGGSIIESTGTGIVPMSVIKVDWNNFAK